MPLSFLASNVARVNDCNISCSLRARLTKITLTETKATVCKVALPFLFNVGSTLMCYFSFHSAVSHNLKILHISAVFIFGQYQYLVPEMFFSFQILDY